ncbi:MAG: stage II sporulation protein P [Roseburia hominis]|nr:stage II sporulation protein P [Roseburia hominis]
MTAAVILSGGLRLDLGELGFLLQEEIVGFFLPQAVGQAQETAELTIADRLFAYFFLLPEESGVSADYQTQVESDWSYEAILAREAADENYVDAATGEVIMTQEAAEQSSTSMPEGETKEQTRGDVPETAEGQQAEAQTAQEAEAQTAQAAQTAQEAEAQTAQTAQEAESQTAQAALATEKVVVYPREKLNDFDYLIQNFYQVDSTTTINSSQLNADALLEKDLRLSHDASTPQILIYHTHSQEGYADSVPGDASTSVVGVGDYLTSLLTERYGFNVIHHKGEYDVGDRDHAYSKAGPGLEAVLAQNPGVEVVIDLHRDGVAESTRLVTQVNGIQMAQVMFFNGLSRTTAMGDIDYLYNPYIADNLAISFQMQLKAAEYYPGFTRRIYLKGYRYNMHYCPKTLLIEVGAQTNTVSEAMNAMVPLADLLNKVLTAQR